ITLTHGETNPAITAEGVEYRALGVSDPELLWDPHRNQWLLFFTATSEAGNRSIGRATIDEEGVVSVRSQPVLDPKTYGLTHLAAPSVVWAPLDTLLMVARTDLDGTTRLRVFNSNADPNGNAGIDWREEFASPELEARTTRTPENPSTGFAADEIGSAGLVIQNKAYHLYVEGRRGARWSIGILASDDLEHWREPREGEAVLGKGNGFDSLGLRSPDAIFLDGQVTLLYEGLSNGGSSLGFAQRVATAATAP
ncbi:MAG: hypothetical protein KC416_11000, partial [Myxococcales bacterium]|nr:hypothetical protein [Myxococcales bacterium]